MNRTTLIFLKWDSKNNLRISSSIALEILKLFFATKFDDDEPARILAVTYFRN
ncbi:hypothetical protein [Lactiplantibacillus pentosus]|jgi:hypothetical protein|uniref:hypothetical protein n=1 Tax=Lactiplantibacillus pentosus TaxID=1589 RepID=UPI001CDB0111|nr:hypothetical protein [Lactiplantibacillus pentosus]